jgi:hypothetical protein
MGELLEVKARAFKIALATWVAIAIVSAATLVGLTLGEWTSEEISDAAVQRAVAVFVACFLATFVVGTAATLAVWGVRARVARRRVNSIGSIDA